MIDAVSQFREVIRASGLEPPDVIEPGKLHRFPGVGKGNGNSAGWCKMFPDCMGGCYGDWSSGFSESWQANRGKPLSSSEGTAFKHHVEQAKAQADAERNAKQAEAATEAAAIWEGATPASDDHAYLSHKQIKANAVRLYKQTLVIPVRDGDLLCSLQFIGLDGEKRFLKGGRVTGCYYIIGSTEGAQALCIAEGFATGATIHEATGHPVVVAFNAGNLEPVAKVMRERFPRLPLVLCADDDAATNGNPGLCKATEAARAVSGRLAVPDFGSDRTDGASDFNDMAALCGQAAVARAIADASAPSGTDQRNSDDGQWPEPLPLGTTIEPKPYPVDALPDSVRAAVEEVQTFTKAPVPLVASSALAALSLAIQAHRDVERAKRLAGPVALFLLTIADSGERKSTCDGFFTTSIRQYEDQEASASQPTLRQYEADMEAWRARRDGIKDKIRQLAKDGKPSEEKREALRKNETNKPTRPKVPRMLYADATPEALAYGLAKNWPSSGVVSAEAGIVFGAHGMGKDSIMRNLALLNQLWDGASLTIDRKTSESFTVRGARLTVALQIQEATLRSFFERSGELARGSGFLARFLVAWPKSTQGFRPFTDPPEHWPALDKFNKGIADILERPVPFDDDGHLSPLLLPLAPATKRAWVAFHDGIESELRSGGELYDVRDVASKTADNAARIAALFQVFEHGISDAIGVEAFEGASRIAAWHLDEARRFFGELALPGEQAAALRLDDWLIDHCQRAKTNIVPRREIQRYVTPSHLRRGAALDAALVELIKAQRLRLVQDGNRKEIHVNPALLTGAKL